VDADGQSRITPDGKSRPPKQLERRVVTARPIEGDGDGTTQALQAWTTFRICSPL
jgi:hypothetical protein